MARFRRTISKDKSYLQYVHSYRNEKGQPATKVLGNLGNITNLSEDEIERITLSFFKAFGIEDRFTMNKYEAGKGYHYGTCLPAIAIWEQLDLDEIITRAIPEKVKIPVSKISLIQTANRFSDPGSKLACYRWYGNSMFSQLKNFVHFPDNDKEKLHTYYRSLDYLCKAKDKIETELYYYFKAYGMDNSLVLYDITSVYFEGEQSEIGAKGYSRDNRSDADQIVMGLVMSRDGIPIAHHIFEGNTTDKDTVEKIIDDLKKRFSIKEIVFVGDRGMITVDNIGCIKEKGNNYIMGMYKRNRRIINFLMTKENMKNSDIEIQEYTYKDLSDELKKEYHKSVRFIACYNPLVAKKTKATRERNILSFEEMVKNSKLEDELDKIKEIHYKLKSFLSKYHMTKFYKLKIDDKPKTKLYELSVSKNNEAVEFEEGLDGRYFMQTEVSSTMFDMKEVVKSYKSLMKVEKAFRVIKNEIDIRPVYVRKETRIKGHVMICYLSLLVEILLEKKLNELFPEISKKVEREKILKKSTLEDNDPLTIKILMEELDTIRLLPLYVNENQKPLLLSTAIRKNIKRLFSSMGIKNSSDPKKLRIEQKKGKKNDGQLELFF